VEPLAVERFRGDEPVEYLEHLGDAVSGDDRGLAQGDVRPQ
jgi:hypothetical protein